MIASRLRQYRRPPPGRVLRLASDDAKEAARKRYAPRSVARFCPRGKRTQATPAHQGPAGGTPETPSPAHGVPGVLLVQPLLQRGEVVQDGGGVHLAGAGGRLEGVGPR